MLEIYLSKVRKVETKIRSNNACIVTINTKPTKDKYCDFRVKDKQKLTLNYMCYTLETVTVLCFLPHNIEN